MIACEGGVLTSLSNGSSSDFETRDRSRNGNQRRVCCRRWRQVDRGGGSGGRDARRADQGWDPVVRETVGAVLAGRHQDSNPGPDADRRGAVDAAAVHRE